MIEIHHHRNGDFSAGAAMKISVIVCTYNRCQSLAKTLDSLAASVLPASDEWEVLVVDNNSNDRTREVTADFCNRYRGRFRYLFEPRQGKSHALNSGARDAHGDILAFTDDDVIVEPAWLRHLVAAFENAEWSGSGGRTFPEKAFSPPGWLSLDSRYALGPLAVFDLGPVAAELTEPPFGNNMAFRKQMIEKYGGFRADFGPPPGNEVRGEDTEFGKRLLTAGERLSYQPAAIAYHAVPESRINKRYFLDWWFDKARTDIRESGPPAGARSIKGIPLVALRRLTVWTIRWLLAVGSSRRFSSKVNVWLNAGVVKECYSEFRRSRKAGVVQAESSKVRL
jgi:glycosyltransferase involved in cell wall biosynthesis